MKMKILALSVLAVTGMSVASANELRAEPVQTVERPAAVAADFATYRVLPGVKASGSAQAGYNLDEVVAAAPAAMTAVEFENVRPSEGNVVYNEITSDYGVLTGHVSVLAADGANVRDIAEQFGLQVEMSESSIGLGVLYAGADADLVELAQLIRESGLARAVKIDVLEHLDQPHY